MQSMGLGGGFFMTVYIKEEEKAYTVIAREKAPEAATRDMFNGNSAKASKGQIRYLKHLNFNPSYESLN